MLWPAGISYAVFCLKKKMPPCRSSPRWGLLSWSTETRTMGRQMPGQLNGNETWCFGMSIKTDSTNTTKTSHGKMRFTEKSLRGDQASRARWRRRGKRLGGWLACGHIRSFIDQLVRVHELVPKLVGGPAELADHTADVPRHPGHPFRSEHDEGDDQKEQQLARAYAEHQPLTVADVRATFAASRSDRAAAPAARSTSPSWAPYRTMRDAETSTPPPRTSSAAPIAIPTSPPCAPTPGMRNRRSGASARSRRASSG